MVLALTGCSAKSNDTADSLANQPAATDSPGPGTGTGSPGTGSPSASPTPRATPKATATKPRTSTPTGPTGHAPASSFALGTRTLMLSRGADRPLRTVVWYPATGAAGGSPRTNATPAAGRFPLLLFSHGLTASPESYASLTTRIAAAGFVVAAPAYPFTSSSATTFNAGDLVNQPADASYVITQVIALDTKAGDPLRGHIDTAHIAAGGHSGGGYTTVGMLSGNTRDNRLKGAIVLSGGSLGSRLSGPATPTLFIHGDSDATVPYSSGRSVYTAMTWPKAFLTIIGGDHLSSVFGTSAVTNADAKTMIDFLRWTLYGDSAARARLAGDATISGTTTWQSSL